MKSYSSFLIRCWLIRDDAQGEHTMFDIEHIQTGERKRTESLTDLQEWFTGRCRAGTGSAVRQLKTISDEYD